MGNVHRHFSRFEEATRCYKKALQIDPKCAEAQSNIGCTQLALGQFDDAERSFRSLIDSHPDHPSAHWNLAVTLLSAGDFERAWPAYEVRWQSAHMAPDLRQYPQPLWLGESPLAGRSLLIHPEQGLGDSLQFVRYVAALAKQQGTVHLEVPRSLYPLLKSFPGASSVFPSGTPAPDFDLHCPLLSLPLAVSRLQAIADIACPPYIQPTALTVESWETRLSAYPGKKIGLVWSGNAKHQNDAHRSPGFDRFAPLFNLPGIQFIQLQTEIRDSDRDTVFCENRLLRFTEHQTDFLQTAGLVSPLDLVITCDTALAHLAGAMGKPVWILLPYNADWRWVRGIEQTQWYPTARLFQQPAPGNWTAVLEKVRTALLERIRNVGS
jgi:hypothetical protein